jgi:DNA mismatch endonuclease (patch repair protein)
MPDVVDRTTRSRMMAGIRGVDTRPEIAVRHGLHRRGFRYRLHSPALPGKPDIVLSRHRAVIFIHGCFWHRHDCHLFKWPSSRPEFWRTKINRNHQKDAETEKALLREGWRVFTVWECALKGRTRRPLLRIIDECAAWLDSDKRQGEITGIGRGDT